MYNLFRQHLFYFGGKGRAEDPRKEVVSRKKKEKKKGKTFGPLRENFDKPGALAYVLIFFTKEAGNRV